MMFNHEPFQLAPSDPKKRFASETSSAYATALRAVERKGVDGLIDPRESDRLGVPSAELAHMAADARSIAMSWEAEDAPEPREVPVELVDPTNGDDPIVLLLDDFDRQSAESARAFAHQRELDAAAQREHRVAEAMATASTENTTTTTSASASDANLAADDFELDDADAALPTPNLAPSSVRRPMIGGSGRGIGAASVSSSKRSITLKKPQFKKALRAATRHHRKQSLRRQGMRLVGAVAVAVGIILLLGCSTPEKPGLVVDYMPGGGAVLTDPAPVAAHSAAPTVDIIRPNESFAPTESVTAPPPPSAIAPSETATNSGTHPGATHVVQRGETLFGIARQYYGDGARWREIADANGIEDGSVRVGQELRLPGQSPNSTANAALSAANHQPVADSHTHPRADSTAASAGPLAAAERALDAGNVVEARRQLSAALYSLEPADEAKAVSMLHELSRRLLGDSGPDGDCRLHTVARGENLYRIAQQYNVTWQSIQKLNQIAGTAISVGQQLRILKGEPKLIVLRQRGVVDLWLGDYMVKRYAARIGHLPAPVRPGVTTVGDKKAHPSPMHGSRVIGCANGENLHGTPSGPDAVARSARIMLANADIDELFDIVRPGTVIEIR